VRRAPFRQPAYFHPGIKDAKDKAKALFGIPSVMMGLPHPSDGP